MNGQPTINDGGPAFPEPAVFDANRGEVNPAAAYGFAGGMTLRDYFIAHAPAEPQPWFRPVMPPRPVVPAFKDAPQTVRDELQDHDYDDYLSEGEMSPTALAWHKEKTAAQTADRQWGMGFDKQRYIQWPAAWADAMLAQRSKS